MFGDGPDGRALPDEERCDGGCCRDATVGRPAIEAEIPGRLLLEGTEFLGCDDDVVA